jgi:hypothetical protein
MSIQRGRLYWPANLESDFLLKIGVNSFLFTLLRALRQNQPIRWNALRCAVLIAQNNLLSLHLVKLGKMLAHLMTSIKNVLA